MKQKTSYNIYYGTIGKVLGYKYRFTREFWTEELAKDYAKKMCVSLFYKNEGKYGIPTFNQIKKESDLTGIDIDTLYNEHIDDMCRWNVIPTETDSIPKRKIK